MNILAERIYLITNEFQVTDENKEMIWLGLKFLIFRGEIFDNKKPIIYNLHLDMIMLCTIYHVFYQ